MFLLALWLVIIAPSLSVAKDSKRGLTFPSTNNPQDVLNINQTKGVVSWIYDWALTPPTYLINTSLEYIPMQWGSGNIENLAAAVKSQNATTLLTFNEPDYSAQSNLDATYAAELWQQYIDPLKDEGVRLGGPAITSSSTGMPWLREFMSACGNCTIDFLTVHWYGEGTAGFYDYLWSLHGDYPNYKVWVTEYADTEGNATDVLQFMNQTTTYMESLDWIERYAWFGYFVGQILLLYCLYSYSIRDLRTAHIIVGPSILSIIILLYVIDRHRRPFE
ncbi:uncharacterized protein BT62DRAFT_909672 [Guyanagaster necrorhizus]|uniref:Asl1-like glycosyl hydrolase catalytic domain-containing protein n=1 Tax=Guyanagaster necrorhizus TaxID=856835 RepID=A0A9P8AM21_9AGAR|nr:uncharacterized protein BT62DRAFT_909672 [Guyanagaster necrorhizus MCA 3950]KAG7440823.1 hypothetical protein BT62DRAFT_909672 [Guyanagaster necrorhizus MCA 3950]